MGADLKSGICTSENWAAPTMGILFMSGDSVTRNLPLMISLCMQTCIPDDNPSHACQCRRILGSD